MAEQTTISLTVTGDEVLGGFVQDAHTGFVAREIRALGARLTRVALVGDDAHELAAGLAAGRGDAVAIVTGGLGPTHDDRTAAAVAEVTGRAFELHPGAQEMVQARITQLVRARGGDPAAYAENVRRQSMLPAGATPLEPLGTAPGFWLVDDGTLWCVLPGPPAEMRHAWAQLASDDGPIPTRLRELPRLHERVVRAWGIPESAASAALERIGHDDSADCQVTLCARLGELEVSIRGPREAAVEGHAEALRAELGPAAWSTDDAADVGDAVVAQLVAAGATIGTAESCTAGLVAARLASVPGASGVLAGGLIVYQEHAKRAVAGVAAETIREHTVVSEEVAAELARGAQERMGTDWAIGTTGWAGPTGGTPERPVGTVCVAVVGPDGAVTSSCERLPGPREMVVDRTVQLALHMTRMALADRSH